MGSKNVTLSAKVDSGAVRRGTIAPPEILRCISGFSFVIFKSFLSTWFLLAPPYIEFGLTATVDTTVFLKRKPHVAWTLRRIGD